MELQLYLYPHCLAIDKVADQGYWLPFDAPTDLLEIGTRILVMNLHVKFLS